MIKKLVILITFCFLPFEGFSQKNDCKTKALDGYIIDGQVYTLTLEDSKTGKIFLSFFDGFQYRFVICSQTTQKYRIDLYDIEKKILFSGSCEDFTKYFDLKFSSNLAGYIEVTVDKEFKEKQLFKVSIGFKESRAAK